jgi:lipopolysaccharide export system protein LptA
MPSGRESLVAVLVAVALAGVAGAEPATEAPKDGTLFDAGSFGNKKQPIFIVSDTLEYDYKANVVVYRGDVIATQGETKVRSDTLTATLAQDKDPNAKDPNGKDLNGKDANGKDPKTPDASGNDGQQRLKEVIAVGNVRIDNGTRWATGGRAVFEQSTRTLVLTENPVLHDGQNEVAGERVTLYLDENRSVVEAGRKRVKAVLYPSKDGTLDDEQPGPPKDEAQVDAGGDAKP